MDAPTYSPPEWPPPRLRGEPRVPANLEEVRVYFDSGVKPGGPEGSPPIATYGMVVCLPTRTGESEPVYRLIAGGAVRPPIAGWDPSGFRLLFERLPDVLSSPGVLGPQLYDLLAARWALGTLSRNGFRGYAHCLGDGEEVIEFLIGRQDALSLSVAELDFAAHLRVEVRDEASRIGRVSWERILPEKNLAETALRRSGRGRRHWVPPRPSM